MDRDAHELPPEHLPLPQNVCLEGGLEIKAHGIMGVPLSVGSRTTWLRGWFLLVEDASISLRQYASRDAVVAGRKPLAAWDLPFLIPKLPT